MIELLPWSNDDPWAVARFLSDPEMMKHLGGPQSREQVVGQHERYLDTAASGTGLRSVIRTRIPTDPAHDGGEPAIAASTRAPVSN